MLFPAKKRRTAHGPEARFPAKKRVIYLTSGCFRTRFPLPQSLYDPVGVRRRHNHDLSDE